MALFDDILSGGNWVTGLAIGVGAVVVLPLAVPFLRPLAKTAIKGGILAYQGAAGLIEGVGDLVAEAVAESGGEVVPPAVEGAAQVTGMARPRRGRTEATGWTEETRAKGLSRARRAERQLSMADITLSWPRLTCPALALRQAPPWR
jgi:hypothetical protein